ncbi:MAG: nickel pincer cofactor biosynthesis protein LarB [Sporolactobacillus sp.]
MNRESLARLLGAVRSGNVPVSDALKKLETLPFEDLGYAKVDHHRALRSGLPEVIYCAGKTSAQIAAIASAMADSDEPILGTRATEADYAAVKAVVEGAIYYEQAHCFVIHPAAQHPAAQADIAVVCAGTSDVPVAEEAAVTATVFGYAVERVYDVGVAGLQRLLTALPRIRRARVIIAVAGMEGALVSVLGGLTGQPVIAVPTSVGYGTNFGGITALLAMLNSCAGGITVVNIDNGFGAAHAACRILAGAGEDKSK